MLPSAAALASVLPKPLIRGWDDVKLWIIQVILTISSKPQDARVSSCILPEVETSTRTFNILESPGYFLKYTNTCMQLKL